MQKSSSRSLGRITTTTIGVIFVLLCIQNVTLRRASVHELSTANNKLSTKVTKKTQNDIIIPTTMKQSNKVDSTMNSNNNKMSAKEFLKFKIEPKQFEIYNHPFPCIRTSKSNNDEDATGFQYIKVYKTASSTVAHIVKYIANKRGSCTEHSNHAAAHEFPSLSTRKTNDPKSFLFTFVREPTKRGISDFFFTRVSQMGREVNVTNFKEGCCRPKLKLNGLAGFQLAYISTEERMPQSTFWNSTDPTMIQHPNLLKDRVNNVFHSYDFIGVSDRLNESLVALSFILHLKLTEIIHVNYRTSGSFMPEGKTCIKLAKSVLTPDIEKYLETDEWKAITAGDKLLFNTANEALDNTIDNVIGRNKFKQRLEQYDSLMSLIKECDVICASACSSNGEYTEPTSCLPCMNEERKQWYNEQKRKLLIST